LLKLSRSGYYRWLTEKNRPCKPVSEELTAEKNRELTMVHRLMKIWSEFPATGYRKMSNQLRKEGFPEATEKRIRLIYQRLGIRGERPKFKTSRPPKTKYKKFPYLLKDKTISYVNQVWATDITYIRLPHGMVYLVAIIDLYSRKILSWRLSDNMETEFCLECLHEAVYKYGIPAIFNSDCGSQFLSNDFIEALQSYSIEISNDGVARCLDNIYVERTWRTLKYECIFLHDYRTMNELTIGLEKFIRFFNSERLHEGLGYQIPDEVYGKGCFPVVGIDIKEEVA